LECAGSEAWPLADQSVSSPATARTRSTIFRARQEVGHESGRPRFLEALFGRCAGRILEEERDRDLQHGRDVLQPAGTDSIGALLVFLDLLESDPQAFSKFFLAHVLHHATQTDPPSHVYIDGIGYFLIDHRGLSFQK
jgi:hypothetical protein